MGLADNDLVLSWADLDMGCTSHLLTGHGLASSCLDFLENFHH